ncbi:MAG: precorrin-6y C5,15-methyltransferase (decarboxylating) subunit CbiE [Halanaerobiaceae bacterium]
MNKVYILGIGPGHKDYLTKIAEDIINSSDILIGGRRVLKIFDDLDKEKIRITADLEKIKNYILKNYQSKVISVIVSGDPGLYSMMNYLKRELSKEMLEVIPGISSLQLASARIKLNWNDMQIVSLHGKNNRNKVIKVIKEHNKVGLFTDHKFPPDQIAAFLLEHGVNNKRAVVFENLSYPDERIISANMLEIQQYIFSNLTVMVIYDEDLEI